jgi:hypothetical protein|tara:strand:+ start:3901 stop:4128 length:228 start_codon:yes stop_codon:yes gene_type:complete
VYTDTLNNKLGESKYREDLASGVFFWATLTPFPFHPSGVNSPKKLTPEERLRRYVEQKYRKKNVHKKKKNVEKKS